MSLLAGCSAQADQPNQPSGGQNVTIAFEYTVSAVENGVVTLDSGKTVHAWGADSVKNLDEAAEIAVATISRVAPLAQTLGSWRR